MYLLLTRAGPLSGACVPEVFPAGPFCGESRSTTTIPLEVLSANAAHFLFQLNGLCSTGIAPVFTACCFQLQVHLAIEAALVVMLVVGLLQRSYRPGAPVAERLTEKVGVSRVYCSHSLHH